MMTSFAKDKDNRSLSKCIKNYHIPLDEYKSKYTTYLITEENFVIDEKILEFQNIIMLNNENFENKANIEFLDQIISALNWKKELNVKVIPLSNTQNLPIHSIGNSIAKRILVFGLRPQKLLINGCEELHTIYKLNNIELIFALNLNEYINNKTNKTALWSSIKIWSD